MKLLPHPGSAGGPELRLEANAGYGPDGALRITWRLTGDLSRLRLPEPVDAPGPADGQVDGQIDGQIDGLWQHTCFEAFVADPHSTGYLELNFSPSGQWAAYGFRSYRTGMAPLPLRNPPRARWQQIADELTLAVDFRMDDLPGPPGPRPPVTVKVGLAAVIEDDQGALHYWALRHPAGKPDFHHAESFALQADPAK